jgi:4'-phosphopantetheinyl transferase EntD
VNSDGTVPGLLGRLLPTPVVWAEAFDDPLLPWVFDAERAAVAAAVPKRQLEYRTVRHCARQALGRLGLPPAPILSGPNREPLWPAGVVGALTHCAGYRAAAVSADRTVLSVGIDAEPHEPLPEGVLERVGDRAERAELAALSAGRHWDRILFCAKEAVYKVWFPLARRWLGFEDARVRIEPTGQFHARLLVPGPQVQGRELTELDGRWLVARGLIITAITLTPDQVR